VFQGWRGIRVPWHGDAGRPQLRWARRAGVRARGRGRRAGGRGPGGCVRLHAPRNVGRRGPRCVPECGWWRRGRGPFAVTRLAAKRGSPLGGVSTPGVHAGRRGVAGGRRGWAGGRRLRGGRLRGSGRRGSGLRGSGSGRAGDLVGGPRGRIGGAGAAGGPRGGVQRKVCSCDGAHAVVARLL
jgi:hypothetical protein